MELTTFSMVLRFTLQLEDQVAGFYRLVSTSGKFPQATQLFAKLAADSDKRKRELERTARESVDHSLLEPISGLFEEAYIENISFSDTTNFSEVLAASMRIEQRMHKFYSEAGEKIKFLSNVSRLYIRYAQDSTKSLASLQGYV